MKFYVCIDAFCGHFYVEFKGFPNDEANTTTRSFLVDIETQKSYMLTTDCNVTWSEKPIERCANDVEITNVEFAYYYHSLKYAIEKGEGKAFANQLLATSAISMFAFASLKAFQSCNEGCQIWMELLSKFKPFDFEMNYSDKTQCAVDEYGREMPDDEEVERLLDINRNLI